MGCMAWPGEHPGDVCISECDGSGYTSFAVGRGYRSANSCLGWFVYKNGVTHRWMRIDCEFHSSFLLRFKILRADDHFLNVFLLCTSLSNSPASHPSR